MTCASALNLSYYESTSGKLHAV